MFLLDSNIFIEASRTYYSPNISLDFWDWLAAKHLEGQVASIPEVKDEILDGKSGHLTTWVGGLPQSFWLKPDQQTVTSMTALSAWTMDPARQYFPAARNDFLSKADYFLVAAAHAGRHVVVTREQPAPDAMKRILIPDSCRAMDVRYADPFSVYEALGLTLTVKPEPCVHQIRCRRGGLVLRGCLRQPRSSGATGAALARHRKGVRRLRGEYAGYRVASGGPLASPARRHPLPPRRQQPSLVQSARHHVRRVGA